LEKVDQFLNDHIEFVPSKTFDELKFLME